MNGPPVCETPRRTALARRQLRAVHQRQPTAGLPPDEAEIVDYVRAVLHTPSGRSSRLSNRCSTRLGVAGMVELTATIGYYSMISCTLNAFELSSSPNPKDFPI